MKRIRYSDPKKLRALAVIAASCHRFYCSHKYTRYELLDSIYVRQDGWAFATNSYVMLCAFDPGLKLSRPTDNNYLLKISPHEISSGTVLAVHASQVHEAAGNPWPTIDSVVPDGIEKIQPAEYVGLGGCWAVNAVQRILDPSIKNEGIWAKASLGRAVWITPNEEWKDVLLVYQGMGSDADQSGLKLVNEKIARIKGE